MNKINEPLKIALAHDSFDQIGGAERVMDTLHELFPNAPVFTLLFDPKFKEKYASWDIRTSGLQNLYLALGKFQYLLPLIPWGVDNLDFSGYDVVISSSSSFVKNLRKPKNGIHICYCHTPTRFLWSDKNYVKQEVPFLLRPIVWLVLNRMKKWDFQGAQRINYLIANSKEVQNRIKTYYNRESEIIYPPINTEFWKPTIQKKDYFLIAGRLQAYKKNDLIIEIFNELKIPLHVVGTGRQEDQLKSIAGPNITFLGNANDEQLRDEYSGALGFIYPQVEDFGLMPLEAAACGTATLAYAKGGALETIVAGQTGEFFEDYNKEKIKQMILSWNPEKYRADILQKQAQKFSKEKFKQDVLKFLNEPRRVP